MLVEFSRLKLNHDFLWQIDVRNLSLNHSENNLHLHLLRLSRTLNILVMTVNFKVVNVISFYCHKVCGEVALKSISNDYRISSFSRRFTTVVKHLYSYL